LAGCTGTGRILFKAVPRDHLGVGDKRCGEQRQKTASLFIVYLLILS
jgi:hypothetical protein